MGPLAGYVRGRVEGSGGVFQFQFRFFFLFSFVFSFVFFCCFPGVLLSFLGVCCVLICKFAFPVVLGDHTSMSWPK